MISFRLFSDLLISDSCKHFLGSSSVFYKLTCLRRASTNLAWNGQVRTHFSYVLSWVIKFLIPPVVLAPFINVCSLAPSIDCLTFKLFRHTDKPFLPFLFSTWMRVLHISISPYFLAAYSSTLHIVHSFVYLSKSKVL